MNSIPGNQPGPSKEVADPEALFRQFAESLNYVFWITEILPEERVVYVNPPVERIWAMSPARFRANPRHWTLSIHPEDRSRVVASFDYWIDDPHHRTFDVEYRVVGDGDVIHWIRDTGKAVVKSGGVVYQVARIAEEVTERKQLEAQLLRAERLQCVGRLAGGIAHDLNNILSPILLAPDLLREMVTDPEARSLLDTIAGSARRGANLLRQLLAFSQGRENDRAPVQIAIIINEVLAMMRETFPKNIVVKRHIPCDVSPVMGSAAQIRQMLIHLCVNFRDAMPSGGAIVVSLVPQHVSEEEAKQHANAQVGPHVLISLSGTCDAIDPEKSIFCLDPAVDPAAGRNADAFGAKSVRSIVRDHCGLLEIDQPATHSQRIRIFLPTAEIETEQNMEASAHSRPGHGELVLIVDDEASVSQLVRLMLEQSGYRAIEAHDGLEAITAFSRDRDEISAVLVDLHMPQMDSRGLLRELNAEKEAIKIVAMTGDISPAKATAIREMGVHEILEKPFTAQQLRRTMQTVLGEMTPEI